MGSQSSAQTVTGCLVYVDFCLTSHNWMKGVGKSKQEGGFFFNFEENVMKERVESNTLLLSEDLWAVTVLACLAS